MLDYVKKYIDTGDLTSKRFQYWLTKSNALNGKIDIVDLGDGQSITGRYLYVLKPQFSSKFSVYMSNYKNFFFIHH